MFWSECCTINVQIVEPDPLAVSFTTNDVDCHGASTGNVSATASGGTGTLTVTFEDALTAPANPAALAAGTYSITVTDANGCMIDTNFPITEPAAPLTLTSSATDEGCMPTGNGTATVVASGGTLGYTYLWNDIFSQITPTASNLNAGIYGCTVTDGNGCVASITQSVLNAPTLSLTPTIVNPTYDGSNDGSITMTIDPTQPGTQPINYAWSEITSPGTLVSTNQSLTGLSQGTYVLQAVDVQGCTFSSAPYSVISPAPITWTWNTVNDPTLNGACDGSVTTIQSAITGGTPGPGYTYQWIGSGGAIGTTLDITGLCEGTYQLTITDANGCTGINAVNIIDPACNVSANIVLTQPTCFGLNGNLDFNATGGDGFYTTTVYEYGSNLIMYSGSVTPPPTPVSLPDGDYYMIVTDGLGCSAQINNVIVTQPDELVVSLQLDPVVCNGGTTGQATATVTGGNGGYVYSWAGFNTSLGNPGNVPVNPSLAAGSSYNLTVTDGNGCSSFPASPIPYTVTEPSPISVVIPLAITEPSCHGGSDATAMATITGGIAPYTYLWSLSGATTNPATGLSAGTESILITDANGCTATESVTITQPGPLTVTLSATDVTCFGGANGTISATPSGGTGTKNYLWSNGATTQFITGLSAGTYSCTVTDASGCATTVSTIVNQGNQIFQHLQQLM